MARQSTPSTEHESDFKSMVRIARGPKRPQPSTRSRVVVVPSLMEWFAREARDLPWRHTLDPYAIWVSEVMLQQTQVSTVVPYWQRWMNALPDVGSLAAATEHTIHSLWAGLGYYSRVRNLQRAAREIAARHEGIVPDNLNELRALPGIGPYTAGAICSIVFDRPTPILDGNVIRVLSRLFGIRGDPSKAKTRTRLSASAEVLVKAADATRGERYLRPCSVFNQALMELGALVCTPSRPHCERCPVERECIARRKNLAHRLPELSARPKSTPKTLAAFVMKRAGEYLVRKQSEGLLNGGLWEFPSVETELNLPGPVARLVAREFTFRPRNVERWFVLKHTITRYRISLQVYRLDGAPKRLSDRRDHAWCSLSELERLPFSSAHKRILQAVVDSTGNTESIGA